MCKILHLINLEVQTVENFPGYIFEPFSKTTFNVCSVSNNKVISNSMSRNRGRPLVFLITTKLQYTLIIAKSCLVTGYQLKCT